MQAEVGNVLRVHQELDSIVKRGLDAAVQLSEVLVSRQLADLVRERIGIGKKQISDELLNCLRRKFERLILGRSHNVLEHAGEGDNELTDKTTDENDTVVSGLGITHVIDLHLRVVLLFPGCVDDLIQNLILQQIQSMLFPELRSSLFAGSLGLSLLLSAALVSFLFLLTLVELLEDSLLVDGSQVTHGGIGNLVKRLMVILMRLHVQVDLAVQLGGKVHANAEFDRATERS